MAADPVPAREVVLVVDDQPEVLEVTAALFRTMGHTVLTASDGASALALLRANPAIGLLFSDVAMPGMNGAELARAAVALRPDLAVLLTSGFAGTALEDAARRFPFLPKPYRMADVLRKLRELWR
jgi:CheY-like chemotaxis protein